MRPRPFRDLPREVAVLAAVAFVVALGFGLVAPALPVFARSFHVGRTAAAAVISAFALMRLVSARGGGFLADRLGERRVLAAGIGVVAGSSLLAGLSQNYGQLLALRGIGGVGSALFSVSAGSLLLRSVPNAQRGRATGVWAGAFLLGGIAGPAFGGAVTGIDIRLPFFLYAGALAVAGANALVALPSGAGAVGAVGAVGAAGDVGAATSTARASRLTLREALTEPAYRAAMAANFADGWAVLGVRTALVPLFVADVLHQRPIWTGVGFVVVAVVNAVVLLPAGRLADARGRRPVLIGGCLLSAAGMVVLALVGSLSGFLAAMAVLGLGSGLLDVAPAAVVGDVAAGRGATAVAAYQMAGDAGTVTGPLVSGRLTDVTSYGAAFGVTAAVLVAAAVLSALAPETRWRSGGAPPTGARRPGRPDRS